MIPTVLVMDENHLPPPPSLSVIPAETSPLQRIIVIDNGNNMLIGSLKQTKHPPPASSNQSITPVTTPSPLWTSIAHNSGEEAGGSVHERS